MSERAPHLLSVNVGRPKAIETGRRVVETAIWKAPVQGRVQVRGVNLAGDDQADRSVHGGPDKAVYAYATEETREWEARPAAPRRRRFPRSSGSRLPCFKLASMRSWSTTG